MIKIFAVRNKGTQDIATLVKAESRSQVVKFLASRVEIEQVGAVDVVDIMSKGVVVEDASSVAVGTPAQETGTGETAPAEAAQLEQVEQGIPTHELQASQQTYETPAT